MPTLALIGRPNVGKSTLFNRLTATRHALVDDVAGTTRDWREGSGSVGPLEFTVLDTAGWEYAKKGSLASRMVEQTRAAAAHASALLLVLDAREGITAVDRDIAREMRKTGKPMAVVLNKAEGKLKQGILEDALGLGLGVPATISAEHNEGMAELYDTLSELFGASSEDTSAMEEVQDIIQIAIIGQPNAGKSTLLNRILGEERVLTGPEAGITRDAIAADFMFRDKALRLVDTAGMRKKAKVAAQKLEKMAVDDALRVIQFANVVVVLMDAACPLENQDLHIVSLVEREGRAIVVALNKWDEVKDKEKYLEIFHYEMKRLLPQVVGVPIVPVSALKGTGVDKLLGAALTAYDIWNKKISTSVLNRWMAEALATHQPPSVKGQRLKFRYITQTKTRPPTFQIFCNLVQKEIPESYLRFLVNNMREALDFPGVPLRLLVKRASNPYAKK